MNIQEQNSYENLATWFKASGNALESRYEQINRLEELQDKKVEVNKEIKAQRGDSVSLSLEARNRLKESEEMLGLRNNQEKNRNKEQGQEDTYTRFENVPYGPVLKFTDRNTGEDVRQIPPEQVIQNYNTITEYLNQNQSNGIDRMA